MKIFVTGATGFIGKHLVTKLVAEGNKITINLRVGKRNPFQSDIKTYSLGERNIETDIQFFKEELFDGIIHLASLYITTHKPQDVNYLIDSNIKFGTYILESAAQAKIKWFINTGTFWQHYQNKEYSPVNLYAATKQAFESIAQYYIETNQIKFCTLKLSDTFGPGDTRPKIFNLWDKIANTGELLEMSPGEQIIDISYIEDIVTAYLLLSNHLQNNFIGINNGDVFAIKSKKKYTLKELAEIFEKTTGYSLNIIWGGKPYREREVMNPWENGKIVPGWEQKVKIEDAITLFLSEKGLRNSKIKGLQPNVNNYNNSLVAIVMLRYNNYDFTMKSIDSIYNIGHKDFIFILIDNGSIDGKTTDIRKTYPDIHYIEYRDNQSYCKAYNRGIKTAIEFGATYISIVHNDSIEYSENYYNEVINVFKSDNNIGLVGTKCYNSLGQIDWGGENHPRLGINMNTPTCGYIISAEAIKSIGGLDEKLGIFYEDLDYIHRLRKNGFKTKFTSSVSFKHLGSGGVDRTSYFFHYYRLRNMFWFMKKWRNDINRRDKFFEIKSSLVVHFGFLLSTLINGRIKKTFVIMYAITKGILIGCLRKY